MTKKEKAVSLRNQKYNCAQAIACAFSDEIGVNKEYLFRSCEGLGSGMGDMRNTCGAVSAAIVLAGLAKSDGALQNPGSKAVTYQYCREIIRRFEKKNKSIICGELKGIKTGVPLRSCVGCIEDAVEIIQDVLEL